MYRYAVCLLIALFMSSPVMAQSEELSNDQLRRMYDDAVAQLRAAQDRRNELARENERLQAQVAEVQQELARAKEDSKRISDETYHVRSERSAWQEFLRLHPVIWSQWFAFLNEHRNGSDPGKYLDPSWPLPGSN